MTTGENHSYSPLIILTGAGTSKACGLPDMRQFAKDFYASLSGQSANNFDQELVCRLIYGLPSIKGNPEPKRDLEALLDGLTRLGGGMSGSCATTSVLMSIAGEMSNELVGRMHNLLQKAEDLVKKSQEQTSFVEGDRLGLNLTDVHPTLAINTQDTSLLSSLPAAASKSTRLLHPSIVQTLGSVTSYEAETVRDISKSTYSVTAERNKALKELPQRAENLALRVKEKIRDAYSAPNLSYVQRVWDPAFQVLRQLTISLTM